MTITIGDTIPTITLRTKTENGIEEISTSDIFKGKKVVLFALPGAFTPTCSAQHLPGFIANAEAIKAKGVDTIACLSVNDAFVMDAWAKDQNVGDAILMLADGNSEFTASTDLGMDGSGFGLGYRSQRYSMLVEDGVVTKINIEEPGQFEKSSAETLLAQL
jgi:glutaredoxin/glutathione-dependent peroxiredoxin